VSSQTKLKIKQKALTLFANNGYEATSMEKIATAVGIKKSSLYTFITSKEALFWEVYEELEDQYHTYMEQVFAESENMSPPARLYYLFKQYLMSTHRPFQQDETAVKAFWIRAMFFPPVDLKDRLLTRSLNREMRLGERYMKIIQEGIKQGLIRDDSPEEILLSYYSLKQGLYSLLYVFMTNLTEEQKLDKINKVWHNYWQGIKG
jgi:Transcriptional regulator